MFNKYFLILMSVFLVFSLFGCDYCDYCDYDDYYDDYDYETYGSCVFYDDLYDGDSYCYNGYSEYNCKNDEYGAGSFSQYSTCSERGYSRTCPGESPSFRSYHSCY
ncbi:MAG: hypothetical protein GY754_15620 [bacterium]|nr:hypothetical protein [bacterium]